jgi:hypothetical protein
MVFYFIFNKRGTDIYIYTDRKEEKGKEENKAPEKKSKTELKYFFSNLYFFIFSYLNSAIGTYISFIES